MTTKIMTANRLRDGLVVYLGEHQSWTPAIAGSMPAQDDDGYQALQTIADTAVANGKVIEAYLIDVEVAGGEIRPARLREAIRATGPTVAAGEQPAPAIAAE
ncbi:MAG: DUF2849 domain-containing protein [Alphaproteobacteria bacterium]